MSWLWVAATLALLQLSASKDYVDNQAVKLLREYIQINTTTYNDLTPAVNFWTRLAKKHDLPISVYEFTEGFPVVVIKWEGTDPTLNSIILNSHMDVVPADENDGWTYPPFEGYLDDNDVIWGRGSQDMKVVSIMYWRALNRIKNKNVSLLRNVYMTLMPDEEVGAENGMQKFLKSEEFKAMNVGFDLDEGGPYDIPQIPVFYQDKVVWQIQIDCHGVAAHGSTFAPTNDTATGKCRNIIDKFFEFREEEYIKSVAAGITNAGTYTSINLNILKGGTANNIVPGLITAVFDIRLGISVNEDAFDSQLQQWVAEAGENITLTYISKNPQSPATRVGSTNPYWVALSTVATAMNYTLIPVVPPASSDARHVRLAGVPAFGISPLPNTNLLAHSVDERVAASTVVAGVDFYEQLIPALANIPGSATGADPSVFIAATTA